MILFSSWLVAVFFVGQMRAYALRKSLIDIPNARSSHDHPVPRGGGLVIVLMSLSALLIFGFSGQVRSYETIALFFSTGLVALIGWRDDHNHVPVYKRITIHLIAAIWLVYWLGGLSSLQLGGYRLELFWLGSILAVLATVWLINLYNFMDGSDGLATVQAICVATFTAIVFYLQDQLGLAQLLCVLIGASLGFLCWNWSPAKIFMGDVASGFLGCFFAGMALIGEQSTILPILIWSILLSLFFWDSTLTLIRRIIAGEKWYSAHRSHAYQRLVQMGYSHNKLAMSFLAINCLILWPIAGCALIFPLTALPLAVLAMIISISLWYAIQCKYAKYQQCQN